MFGQGAEKFVSRSAGDAFGDIDHWLNVRRNFHAIVTRRGHRRAVLYLISKPVTQVNIWYCEISQSLRNTATKCRVPDPADIEII
jgi:hypothetical protein